MEDEDVCQKCNGTGDIIVIVSSVEAGCCEQPLSNGECCGNAVPVQVPVEDLQPCGFCEGRGHI